MIKGNKQLTLPLLSALSLAVLTACGGGGTTGTLGNGQGTNWFGTQPEGLLPNGKLKPRNEITPPVSKFLVEMDKQGQQSKNIVTLINHNNQNKYYTAEFNQPGIISEICQECPSIDRVNKLIERKYDALIKKLEVEKAALSKNDGDDKNKKTDNSSKISDLELKIARLQQEKESRKLEKDVQYMVDTNNVLHSVYQTGSVDGIRNPNGQFSAAKAFMSKDAGLNKIDGQWVMENGAPVAKMHGGFIDKAFSRILVFQPIQELAEEPQNPAALVIYLRDPSIAGFKYNTFGVFKSSGLLRNRDAEYGYQSIGALPDPTKPEEKVPEVGKADYSGISHAYIHHQRGGRYENDQITMNVDIHANFAKRNLSFKTSDATLHTYETVKGATRHMITNRPDLNLSGGAGWGRGGQTSFRGTVQTADGKLGGNLEGSFYGPNAAEAGGVYGLWNKDNSAQIVGGFGAKRP